jgi:hypothetical protein
MKILVLITTLLVISNASSLCNTCIRLTEMVQSGLILITPTFVAKDVVKSVCEKQCIFKPIQINPKNFVKKSLKN